MGKKYRGLSRDQRFLEGASLCAWVSLCAPHAELEIQYDLYLSYFLLIHMYSNWIDGMELIIG